MRRRARPARRRFRALTRRAFTVIELMLALALSAVVIGAAIGLYRILGAAQRVSEERFEQAADLAVTQMTLRRIMNTLVCASSQPVQQPPPGAQDDDNPSDVEGEGAEDEQDESDQEDQQRASAAVEVAPPAAPVMFSLTWVDVSYEDSEVTVPIIELVVTEPPVPLAAPAQQIDEENLDKVDEAHAEEALRLANRLSESVRGVIEVIPWIDGWRLQWRPIEPAAMPFPLFSNIATNEDGNPALSWRVLDRNEKHTEDPWMYECAAKIHDEFPQAVRLEFDTTNGRRIDWLFETHDTVQE